MDTCVTLILLGLASCYAAGIDRFDNKLLETRIYDLEGGKGLGLGLEGNKGPGYGYENVKGIGLGYDGGKVLELSYERGLQRNEGKGGYEERIGGYEGGNGGYGVGKAFAGLKEIEGYGERRRGYGENRGFYGEGRRYDENRGIYNGYEGGYSEDGGLGGYGYSGYRGYGVGYVGHDVPRILGRFGLGYDRRTYFAEGLSAPLTAQELQVVGRGYYGRLYRPQNYDYEQDLKNDKILKYD